MLNPLDVLLRLLKRNYQNLMDARETFEVISYRMSVLENPEELVAFLGQHLKPKELEKKQYGEVFTPPSLIEQKLDALARVDPTIWSDPGRKFLDPANGIGNYPALVFHRLMNGLRGVIPNESERKKHILENMLYMCELNKKNVEVSRKILDPESTYKLNLVQGNYLALDPVKVWGLEKDAFDIILGNPPYQPHSLTGKANGGKSLWPSFVEYALNMLKPNGYLVFVHPAIWRKPNHFLHNDLFSRQFKFLSIHTKQEGAKLFHATTRYDWYILQNRPPTEPAEIRYDDGVTSKLMITPALPYIANHGGDILQKVAERDREHLYRIAAICTSECHEQHLKKAGSLSTSQRGDFHYPCVNSTSKTKGIRYIWSKKLHSAQFEKKVIFSDNEIIVPFYDSGVFGLTQHGIYILVESEQKGEELARFLSSKLVKYIVAATKWSNFGTFPEIFGQIPVPQGLPAEFTDEDVYRYFHLTKEEIKRIEDSLKKSAKGLEEYTPLVPPSLTVHRPSAAAASKPTAQVLSTASIATLKDLCKEKKLKGYSGKSKAELIQVLTAAGVPC